MSGKQKEGDNQRRRGFARRARRLGRTASDVGRSLGASKQFEHAEGHDRAGPPFAGAHKWGPEAGGPPLEEPLREPSWPSWRPSEVGTPIWEPATVQYRDLVAEVSHRARLDFDTARPAAEAAITVLARCLNDADRQRLLDATPTELHDDDRVDVPLPGPDLASFVREVAAMSGRTPEQARYQAQAVLSALADRAPELVASLDVPPYLRDLLAPPPEGGGVVGASGRVAALTDDELRAALDELPYWSGDRNNLCRTLVLPPGNMERVLQRLARLKLDLGRAPHIGRRADGTAVLVVRTNSIDAVTRLDVDLAHAVDAAIDEAAAGMAAPPPE